MDQQYSVEWSVVSRGATWTWACRVNGVPFAIETVSDPDGRHLLDEVLRGYKSVVHARRVRAELDRGIV